MTTKVLKENLHKAIDTIQDDSFLQAVLTIVNEKKDANTYDLSAEQWAEIDHRVKLHKTDKSKSYSLSEVVKYAKQKAKK